MSPTTLDHLRIAAVAAAMCVWACGCNTLPKTADAQAQASGPGSLQSGAGGRLADGRSGSVRDENVEPASLDRPTESESNRKTLQAAAEAEEDDGFDLEDLDPSKLYRKVRDAAGFGPDEGIARGLYEEGADLYRAENYGAAGDKFAAAAKRWPDSALEEDSLFLAGESYFYADKYPAAHRAYQKLLKKHDYTRHLDRVTKRLFSIGRYWDELAAADPPIRFPVNLTDSSRPWIDTTGYAIKAYDDIRMYDPTGPLADDAVMASANSYFVRGLYSDSAQQYDLLRTEYTKSEHQLRAHLLSIESWQRLYQGGYYDNGPLKKAGEVADQALVQFGAELGAERPRVIEAKNKIVEEMANRDWLIGQYYDKRKYYRAARFYYESILREYPQTAAAQAAETRLAEIQGLPDVPANHFKWFTDMFDRRKY